MAQTLEQQMIGTPSQNDDVVLSVKGVSKKFCRSLKRSLWYGVQDLASELLGSNKERDYLRKEEFWALKSITFELRRGEAFGLVEANGAGKTTILRIISGLIKPDEGGSKISGRIAPLIALGAGFNPILTGKENIYTNMAILGLTKQEIDDRFDDVVAFAEIGDALDSPVQNYSSGMAARLGFACAIHVEPDILLVDEVLSVGDIRFRSKCYRKLAQLQETGASFILVSHNPLSVLQICDSAIYLLRGEMKFSGNPENTMNKYEEDLFLTTSKMPEAAIMKPPKKSTSEKFGLNILEIYFSDANNPTTQFLESGKKAYLNIICDVQKVFEEINIYLTFTEMGQKDNIMLFSGTAIDNIHLKPILGIHNIQLEFPHLGLSP